MASGGVAPLAQRTGQAVELQARLGGLEEKFAFERAASRLAEMQTDAFLQLRQSAAAHGSNGSNSLASS